MTENILHDQSKKIGFLSIEGNLDKKIQSSLFDILWQKSTNNKIPVFFVVVDDPFLRWTRLVCEQYLVTSYSNFGLDKDDFIDFLLYNKICCEDFTSSQIQIIKQSGIQSTARRINFLPITSKLGYTINHFLHDNNIVNKFNNSLQLDYYNLNNNINKLKTFLNKEDNKPYLNKVMKYLNDDYNFINSIETYAR